MSGHSFKQTHQNFNPCVNLAKWDAYCNKLAGVPQLRKVNKLPDPYQELHTSTGSLQRLDDILELNPQLLRQHKVGEHVEKGIGLGDNEREEVEHLELRDLKHVNRLRLSQEHLQADAERTGHKMRDLGNYHHHPAAMGRLYMNLVPQSTMGRSTAGRHRERIRASLFEPTEQQQTEERRKRDHGSTYGQPTDPYVGRSISGHKTHSQLTLPQMLRNEVQQRLPPTDRPGGLQPTDFESGRTKFENEAIRALEGKQP